MPYYTYKEIAKIKSEAYGEGYKEVRKDRKKPRTQDIFVKELRKPEDIIEVHTELKRIFGGL